MGRVIEPMLAQVETKPFNDPGWLFEKKADGERAILFLDRGKVRLQGRGFDDITDRYPDLQEVAVLVKARQAVLDGEIVCFEPGASRDSFQRLQQRSHKSNALQIKWAMREYPVHYLAFTVLELEGTWLGERPERDRKLLLFDLFPGGPTLAETPFHAYLNQRAWPLGHTVGNGASALALAVRLGCEGVMAKRLDGRYLPGKRVPWWRKVKVSQESMFLAVGLTPGEGSRASTFGALVLAERDEAGGLRHIGSVGSGFKEADLERIRGEARPRVCPWKQEPEPATWCEPFPVRVKYLERTADGKLRFPVFKREGVEA